MNAKQFVNALFKCKDSFPAHLALNHASTGNNQGAWTEAITAWLGATSVALSHTIRSRWHVGGEDRFDYSLVPNALKGTLPSVLIEHELSTAPKAFDSDFRKLLLGFAPVRVMFGYVEPNASRSRVIEQVNKRSAEFDWQFPENTEDVLLVGYHTMTGVDRDNWVLAIRGHGTSVWRIIEGTKT